MGILEKLGKAATNSSIPQKDSKTNSNIQTIQNSLDLTKQELEFIFDLIKNSSFKGADLQIVFGILSKLQTKYLEQTKSLESNK